MGMNTKDVAEILGVSSSTIKRWVRQLELPMERNERGHYIFQKEDITVLSDVHEQIQNGANLLNISPLPESKIRKGVVRIPETDRSSENLMQRIKELESRLDQKADSVTSYQLLHHRQEMEEMQIQISTLTSRIEMLEGQLSVSAADSTLENPKPLILEQTKPLKRQKRKNILTLFGF
jgi:chromosome-anchoring protein RacA